MLNLIENWQNKNLKCHFCDSTESVKYETEVFDPVVDAFKPVMVCLCNKCVVKHTNLSK